MNSGFRLKGAALLSVHIEMFSLNFSSWSFVIRVYLHHPEPSLILYGLLLSSSCSYIFGKTYFLGSFSLKVILYSTKMSSLKLDRTSPQDVKGARSRYFR